MNCSDKFQQFLVGCERPCDHAAKAFLGQRCSVRQWMHVLRQHGRLLEEFLDFYVNVYTRLLRSILVLLFSLCEVVALVVDPDSGLFSILVLLVKMHLALCSGRLPSRRMEKCTQFMLRPTIFPEKSGHYFFELLDFAVFPSCAQSPLVFFWEPSTTKSSSLSRARGGVAGSLTPR